MRSTPRLRTLPLYLYIQDPAAQVQDATLARGALERKEPAADSCNSVMLVFY
jgi:hypothetical protein